MKLKSLSLGVDTYLKSNDFYYILNKYKDYIDNIYLGVPDVNLSRIFTSREPEFYSVQNYIEYYQIIKFARSLGIKINLTLNSTHLFGYDNEEFKEPPKKIIDYYYDNHFYDINFRLDTFVKDNIFNFIEIIQPDEICCTDILLEFLRENYSNIKYCRTFHEGLPTNKTIQDYSYDIYVLRNTYPFTNHNLINNANNRIVINTICPMFCRGCKFKGCKSENTLGPKEAHYKDFDEDFNNYDNSLEKYLAYHLWLGEDIDRFEKIFKNSNLSYKLANRGIYMTKDKLDFILANYISGDTLSSSILEEKNNYYYLKDMGTNTGLNYRYLSKNIPNPIWNTDFNFELYHKYKDDYWNSIESFN